MSDKQARAILVSTFEPLVGARNLGYYEGLSRAAEYCEQNPHHAASYVARALRDVMAQMVEDVRKGGNPFAPKT